MFFSVVVDCASWYFCSVGNFVVGRAPVDERNPSFVLTTDIWNFFDLLARPFSAGNFLIRISAVDLPVLSYRRFADVGDFHDLVVRQTVVHLTHLSGDDAKVFSSFWILFNRRASGSTGFPVAVAVFQTRPGVVLFPARITSASRRLSFWFPTRDAPVLSHKLLLLRPLTADRLKCLGRSCRLLRHSRGGRLGIVPSLLGRQTFCRGLWNCSPCCR